MNVIVLSPQEARLTVERLNLAQQKGHLPPVAIARPGSVREQPAGA